jgi:hypothetical protein
MHWGGSGVSPLRDDMNTIGYAFMGIRYWRDDTVRLGCIINISVLFNFKSLATRLSCRSTSAVIGMSCLWRFDFVACADITS